MIMQKESSIKKKRIQNHFNTDDPKTLHNITMDIAVLESVICDFSREKGNRIIQFMPGQKVYDLHIRKRTKQLQQSTND